jgi:DHA1 family bicyclomycin/chloramphenicol resistance-like MFS transporter
LPSLIARFQSEAGVAQLTISLSLLGLAVSQLVLGPLSDRYGRRPVVLGGLALAAVASLIAMFAGTITGLVAARVAQALGASTGQVIGRAIVRDLYARERAASVLGMVTSAVVVMPMMAPLIGGLLDSGFGWQSIFVFMAAISFAVLAWAALALPETHQPSPTAFAPARIAVDLGALAASPRFFGYILAVALGSAPFYTFMGGAPYVIITQMGRSSAEYGIWFALSAIGFMAGNVSAARFAPRFGIDRMIRWGILVTVAGTILPIACWLIEPQIGPLAVFLPQAVISYGNGLLLPTAVAGAVSIRPEIAGTASGITGATQMTIGAVATQLVSHALAGAETALPMLLLMLGFGLATAF